MNRIVPLLALCLPMTLGMTACQKKQATPAVEEAKVAALPSEKTSEQVAESKDGEASDSSEEPASKRRVHKCGKGIQNFNRAAIRLNVPLYWVADKDGDMTVDDDELIRLSWPSDLLDSGKVNDLDSDVKARLDRAVALVESWMHGPIFPDGLTQEELTRRNLVVKELDQGQPILIHTDLKGLSDQEKTFVRAMLKVGANIDAIYGMQTGATALKALVPADDRPSQSLFRRNWGPKCLGPMTENDENCSALPAKNMLKVGLYPEDIQDKDAKFCKSIEADPALNTPFTVVRRDGEKLVAVPYSQAWPERMKGVSSWLKEAAQALSSVKGEEALVKYLNAAAESFLTNDWNPADEAWAAMNGQNSKWYVRVGPDEVYWEPCSLKAGIHMTFARINPDALVWQNKLTPMRQELENALAQMAGEPYVAREVSFQLPDFIDIVMNFGDDRDPYGATIGQSLPNWGPVANEGRGRTIAMSNLYTDEVSLKNRRDGAASLLSAETMTAYTDATNPGLLSTILHEAAHNLGPSHEYKVDGKTDNDVFGGPTASTAEELKAQTAALWFVEKLQKDGILTEQEMKEDYVDAITWAFGHISRGMFDGSGRPKHYSQLAAIQVGFLLDEGAIAFDAEQMSANGSDKGAFTIHFDKFPAAAAKLMKVVAGLKAQGNKAAMDDLIQKYVKGDRVPQALITERLLRYPKASFVYSVDL